MTAWKHRIDLVERLRLEGEITSLNKNLSTDQVIVTAATDGGGTKDNNVIVYQTSPNSLTEQLKLSVASLGIVEPYYDDTIEVQHKQLLKRITSSDPYTESERNKMREKYESIKNLNGSRRQLTKAGWYRYQNPICLLLFLPRKMMLLVLLIMLPALLSKSVISRDFSSMRTPFLLEPALVVLPYRDGVKVIDQPSLKASNIARAINEDYSLSGCVYEPKEGLLYMLWGRAYEAGIVQTHRYDKDTRWTVPPTVDS